jgi:hypothetical protein
MKKLPKWPKGLKTRLTKARKKAERDKEIAAEKKAIASAKAELKRLTTGRKSKG